MSAIRWPPFVYELVAPPSNNPVVIGSVSAAVPPKVAIPVKDLSVVPLSGTTFFKTLWYCWATFCKPAPPLLRFKSLFGEVCLIPVINWPVVNTPSFLTAELTAFPIGKNWRNVN